MIGSLILLVVALLFGIIAIIKSSETCGFLCGMFFTLGVVEFIQLDAPQAIDVYRGKTTLEITYRDSIPIDSTVVFKYEK